MLNAVVYLLCTRRRRSMLPRELPPKESAASPPPMMQGASVLLASAANQRFLLASIPRLSKALGRHDGSGAAGADQAAPSAQGNIHYATVGLARFIPVVNLLLLAAGEHGP